MTPVVIQLLEKGFSLQQQGDLHSAKNNYLEVLKQEKNNQFALNLLGVVYIQMDEHALAETYLIKALEINNQDPETYTNLGLVYKELKQLTKAQTMFEKSLTLNSKQPNTLNNLGNIFAGLNQHDKAVYCFDSALKIDNKYVDCLNNLTLSLKALGQLDKAKQVIEYTIKVDPKRSVSFNNLGEISNSLTEYENAEIAFNKAIEIDGSIVAKINLSTTLKQLGKASEAVILLKEVISIEENNSEALNHLGVLYEQLGEFELAANYFRESIKYTPNHASSFYQLSKLKQQSLTLNEVNKLKTLIEDEAQIDLFKFSYHLALACEYDKTKKYNEAIEHFIKAKAIKAQSNPFDPDKANQYIELVKSIFTLNKIPLKGLEDNAGDNREQATINPIFIIGMPRSGTTLTEQILASHSSVIGAGELGFVNDIAKEAVMLTNTPYPQCVNKLDAKQCEKLRSLYLSKVGKLFDINEYFVDKNPLNYNSVGFIATIFPEAKFIYCKRNAMDNCVSIFKLPFDDNQTYSHDLAALGQHYLQHNTLMTFWQETYPNKILTVNYEDTVADIEKQVHRLIDFIGLNFEDSMLNFHQNKRIVLTPSAEQVRQPIYKSSINAWQRYGELLAPLQKSLNYTITELNIKKNTES